MNNKISTNRFNSGYSMFGGFRKVGTTLNFGELTPVMCDEVLENDSWRIQFSNHFDIAPMACRTFADIFYNQGAFFCSCSQLDKHFENIRALKEKHLGSAVPDLLRIKCRDIIDEILCDFRFRIDGSNVKYVHTAIGSGFRELFDAATYQTERTAQMISYAGKDRDVVKKDNLIDIDDDFAVVFDDRTNEKFYICTIRYNRKGALLRKIFDGLGYKMPYLEYDFTDLTSTGQDLLNLGVQDTDSYLNSFLNPYPLIAYCKIYDDYFSMSSVREENFVSAWLDDVYNRRSPNVFTTTDLLASSLIDSLLACSIQLVSDDVTRCTRDFYGNNNPFFSGTDTKNLKVYSSKVDTTQPGTLYADSRLNYQMSDDFANYGGADTNEIINVDNGSTGIGSKTTSSFIGNKLVNLAHRFLLTQKFLGGKNAKRLRTFFGVSDPIDDAKHSIKCGVSTIKVNVAAETSTANVYSPTEPSGVKQDVGSKYGLANAQGVCTYTYANKNLYGIGIVLNWLSVRTIYRNRMPKLNLKIHKDDLYNGLFDGQGFAQCKSQFEVNCDKSDPSNNYVFGQEPLFDEYRNLSVDFMSGDLLRYNGMDSYLLPRNFRNIVNKKELFAEFSAVRAVRQATDEFNEVFIDRAATDPFVMVADVQVQANRHIQDSVHALGLPTGDQPIILQDSF